MKLETFLTRLIWLCMVPLVLLAVYLGANHVRTVQARVDQEAADQVHNTSAAIDRQLRAQIAALQMLASSPLVDDPSRWKDFYKEAEGFRDNFGGHVILVDVSMQMLLNTRAPFGAALPKLPRPRGRAAAPTALETGKPAVGDIVLGPVAGEPLVAVAVPVRRDGETRYVLLATIETRQFQQRLNEIALSGERFLGVFDGNNEIIARRTPPQGVESTNGEVARKSFVVKSAVSPWAVTVEIPSATYRAPIIGAAVALAAAILVATLVGLAGGRMASRGLVRSVAALTDPSSSSHTSPPAIAEIEAVRRKLADEAAAREAAETLRRESETGYRRIVETTHEGVLTVDAEFRITFVNRRMLDLLGYREDEMLGRTPFSFLHEESQAPALESARSRGKGKVDQLELRFLRRDGSSLWALVGATPILEADERFNGAVAMVTDITARKGAEQRERELSDRLRNILESISDSFVAFDRDWRYTYVNPRAAELFGRSVESLLGKNYYEEYPEAAGTPFEQAYRKAMTERVAVQIEAHYAPWDRWFENRIYPTEDGISIFFHEITDRKRAELEIRHLLAEAERGRAALLSVLEDERRAEKALRESEERYRALFDLNPSPMWLYDTETLTVMSANVAAAKQYGYAPEEFDGFNVFAFYSESERAALAARLDAAGARLDQRVFETRHLRRDGSEFPVEIHGAPIELRDRLCRLVLAIDITERKRAETEIRESHRRLETLMDNLPGLVYRCRNDPQWTTEFVSRGGRELTGYAPEDLTAQRVNLGDLILPEDRKRVWETVQCGVQARRNYEVEYGLRTASGQIKWLWERGCGVYEQNGDLVALEGFVTDVTERKVAQEELAKREQILAQAEATAHLGSFEWDMRTNQSAWSEELYRLYGLQPDQCTPSFDTFLQRVHPDERDKVREATIRAVTNDLPLEMEERIVRPDGSERILLTRAHVEKDPEGKPARLVGACLDITERKRAEEALKLHAQRLRELSQRLVEVEETERRAINRELHDRIGPALSSLGLSIALIRNAIPEEMRHEVDAQVRDAQQLIGETTAQLRNIMAELRPPALDDYGLSSALRAYAEPFAARLGVPVTVDGDDIQPRLPLGAETALFRIAQEALNNVAKHARARQVHITLGAAAEHAVLTVADDGAGFDPAHTDPRRARWGLRTMRERAEAIGADFRIESAPGKGTRVFVDVPRKAV